MLEAVGNLWKFPALWRVITTNGTIKKNSEAVLGRGCAYEAKCRYPGLPAMLGRDLENGGNHVRRYWPWKLIVFPVKYNWFDSADLDLIQRSVAEFERQINAGSTYVMPRPGCGNGNLKWDDVRPLLVGLPDNVTVINRS